MGKERDTLMNENNTILQIHLSFDSIIPVLGIYKYILASVQNNV